jgi:septal ring factor EnvC (AmiA/AmiB activator)
MNYKMKTKQILKHAALVVVLLILVQTGQAQNGNRARQTSKVNTCLQTLPNLTDDQQKQITSLNESHQKNMDLLRNERRSTTDERTKAEIRIKMLDQRDAHRAEVNKLLTPEQQLVYKTLNQNGGQGNCMANQRPGRGQGQGNRSHSGNSGRGQRGCYR